MRDAFSSTTKRTLAERAGFHCSNPSCRAITTGPDASGEYSIRVGVAAHITAASPEGPRFDHTLSPDERSRIDNGVWLCARCATLIDKKPAEDFSTELLREWKRHAEDAARKGIINPGEFAAGTSNAYTVGSVFRFKKPSEFLDTYSASVPKEKQLRMQISISHLGGPPLHEPHVPILLDRTLGPSPTACVFMLCLENQGTAVDPWAGIKLRVKGANIWKQKLESESRTVAMNDIGEGKAGIAGMRVDNLMPGEVVYLKAYCDTPGPFNAEVFYSNPARGQTPTVCDIVFGEPEVVDLLPENPEFDQSQYPFGW